jgi:hypothetical protein
MSGNANNPPNPLNRIQIIDLIIQSENEYQAELDALSDPNKAPMVWARLELKRRGLVEFLQKLSDIEGWHISDISEEAE